MTVVLVHGAWHSPWFWHAVTPRLREPVTTVDLLSCGDSCGSPRGDMHEDAAAIARVLDACDDAVTLVAHSPTAEGLLTFVPERAIEVLFHDCPDPQVAAGQLRPMAPAALQQAPDAVAWKTVPSAYVVCTRDRASAVSVQRRLTCRTQRVFELDTGHSAFLARPDRVAEIIAEVAAPPSRG